MMWRKLTDQGGKPIYLNLDAVVMVKADLHEPVHGSGIIGRSYIEFIGGRGSGAVSSIVVRETPEQILDGINFGERT